MPELVGVPEAAPAANAQARLFELLLGLLGRLAAEVPILLVVEDLHWADGATQDLLRFLARNLRTSGCCCWSRCARMKPSRRACSGSWASCSAARARSALTSIR